MFNNWPSSLSTAAPPLKKIMIFVLGEGRLYTGYWLRNAMTNTRLPIVLSACLKNNYRKNDNARGLTYDIEALLICDRLILNRKQYSGISISRTSRGKAIKNWFEKSGVREIEGCIKLRWIGIAWWWVSVQILTNYMPFNVDLDLYLQSNKTYLKNKKKNGT